MRLITPPKHHIWAERPAPGLLMDPPDLHKYAMRSNPPMSKWPGKWQTKYDVMASCGDDRDWFRAGHKLAAYRQVCMEFFDARRRRRTISKDFAWDQILILGDFGAGKTTLMSKIAVEWFRLGHPVFSNASILFGWHLESEEMYTAMGFMPRDALLLIDESSAALAGRVGHGVAISSFNEMNLNSRKRSAIVVYASAMDWEIAASIRRTCKQVWRPIPKDTMIVEGGEGAADADHAKQSVNWQADNPENFRVAWDVWDDFPYRKADLIDGKQDEEGFGDPDDTMYDDGDNVRLAFLLNDTFQLAKAGAATMADREVVKGQLDAFHHDGQFGGDEPEVSDSRKTKHQLQLLTQMLLDMSESGDAPAYLKPAHVANYLDINPAQAGQLIQRAAPVSPVKGKGYPTAPIFDYLAEMMAVTQGLYGYD